MSTEQYYRVGQVAEALRLAGHQVSEYQVRKLCDAGMIKTVIIQGQRRIPVSECQRLIRDGPPMIPAILENEPRLPARRRPANYVRHRTGDEFLAPRSAKLVTSNEQRLMSEDQKAIAENQAAITGHEATIARNLVENPSMRGSWRPKRPPSDSNKLTRSRTATGSTGNGNGSSTQSGLYQAVREPNRR